MSTSGDEGPLEDQIKQSEQQYDQQEYQQLIKKLSPKPTVLKNSIWAFLIGGFICAIAQVLFNLFSSAGLVEKDAQSAVILIMIFLGAFLTGIGVYDSIAKIGGAGAIVPITGFANSIVSPALEFKREGYVFGVGARMFTIAGPVLVYGFITSILVGLIVFSLH